MFIPFAIFIRVFIVFDLISTLSTISFFSIASFTCSLFSKSVRVTTYESCNGFLSPSYISTISGLSLKIESFIWFKLSSLVLKTTVLTPSKFLICSPNLVFCSWVMVSSFFMNTCIPCCLSMSSIIWLTFSPIAKKIPNINIVAHIITKDATVDFLFLNTFLNPSLIKYPNTITPHYYSHLFCRL